MFKSASGFRSKAELRLLPCPEHGSFRRRSISPAYAQEIVAVNFEEPRLTLAASTAECIDPLSLSMRR
jgi:hypothetical protein